MRALLVIPLLAAVTAATSTSARSPNWSRMADMPTARSAHAVAATQGGIYVLAGTGSDGNAVRAVERFDGKRWSAESMLPGEGRNAPAAAAIGNVVYLIGGFGTTTNRPTTAVQRYDIATREWRDAAPLPAPRGGHAAAVLNGRIHVIGGGNSVSTIDDHSVYDPKTNAWSERAKLPRRMGSPAAVVVNGRLYSIGGRSGPEDFEDVHVYDPAKDHWTPGPALPSPRGTAGAAALRGSIYVVGGESQAKKTVLGDVLRLAPGGRAWTNDTPMPVPRNYARVVLFQGRLYVVGGSTEFGASHSSRGSAIVEQFDPGKERP